MRNDFVEAMGRLGVDVCTMTVSDGKLIDACAEFVLYAVESNNPSAYCRAHKDDFAIDLSRNLNRKLLFREKGILKTVTSVICFNLSMGMIENAEHDGAIVIDDLLNNVNRDLDKNQIKLLMSMAKRLNEEHNAKF